MYTSLCYTIIMYITNQKQICTSDCVFKVYNMYRTMFYTLNSNFFDLKLYSGYFVIPRKCRLCRGFLNKG